MSMFRRWFDASLFGIAPAPMRSLEHKFALASFLITGCVVMGCSGEKRIPTYPVSGKVVAADGSPVDRALIVLHPQSSNATAPKPRGTTQADGCFEVSTFNTADGAPEGKYQVTIERWVRKDPNESPVNHLPPNLASPATSGIEVEVKSSPNTLEPFRLR
jgi:hypothetical protein